MLTPHVTNENSIENRAKYDKELIESNYDGFALYFITFYRACVPTYSSLIVPNCYLLCSVRQ